MIILRLVSLLCFLAGSGDCQTDAGDKSSQKGEINGSVVDSFTGAPVESAQVILSGPSRMTTSSDEGGRFTLRNLSKGSYFVSVSKNDSGVISSTRFVTLSAGNKATVNFRLVKEASISGRVVNEAGIGVPGMRVQALVNGTRYGRPFVMPRGVVVTDSSGVYKIGGLRRGSYVVELLPKLLVPAPGMATPKEPQAIYRKTYYPDAFSISDSSAISLDDGQQATDIDLPARKTSGYCVNTTLPAWLERDAEIVVSMGDGGSAMEALAATGVLTLTRSFHVCGLPSGDYTLMVSLQSASGTPEWFGLESVTVDKKSLTLGEIGLQQPVAEKVMATIDDKLPTALPAALGLSLEPVGRLPFAGETVRADVDSSGQITFPRLFRGEYWVNSDGPTSPFYVADISAGSRDGSHRPIVIGEGPLALRLKSDGASLSGTVTTEDASGSLPDRGIVLAFHTEKGLVRLSQLDQENKFSFQGLPPGGYKIMALFGIERDSLESPLVFQRWLSQAQEVSLSPYAARDIEIHPVVVRR